jgi:GNAT superfamily N-acetyltransferase
VGGFSIRRLERLAGADLEALVAILHDCVEGGASLNFVLPMTRAKAERFWRGVAPGVERGERMLWVAEDDDGTVVGTVQVVLAAPENQAHRADLAKMLVRRSARGRGIGAALLDAAERGAREAGRTLLVLDTATDSDGARLYARHGWTRCGDIPGYALWPDGQPCVVTIFYKPLERR